MSERSEFLPKPEDIDMSSFEPAIPLSEVEKMLKGQEEVIQDRSGRYERFLYTGTWGISTVVLGLATLGLYVGGEHKAAEQTASYTMTTGVATLLIGGGTFLYSKLTDAKFQRKEQDWQELLERNGVKLEDHVDDY